MQQDISTTAEAHEADALPRKVDIHTEEDAAPLPEAVARTPMQQKSPAQWAYERLILYIQTFEEKLDEAHEVAMALTGSGVGVMRIEGMGYFDPDIVTFYGRDEQGARTQLIQHVSQLSVILRAVPIMVQSAPARRIGFELARDLVTDPPKTT